MERKKKYHGGLFLFFATLFVLLFINTFSYASSLTPINQLTPEILKLFIDEIHNNQAFLLKSSTVYNNYNSFYSSFTEQNLNDFCSTWNNIDFSNYADYLEQCLFLLAYDGTTPSLAVVFSNNNIGNKSLHTQYLLNSTTNTYVYSIDDNNNKIASLKYNINFNGVGTLTLTSSSYPSTGFNYKFIDITNTFYYLNDTAFETPMIYCYGRPHSIYINIPTKTDGYKWSLLSGNSVLLIPSPVIPDTPSGDSSTGTITNSSGDVTGQIDLSGIENGIGNINNNLNNIQNQISGDTTRIIENQNNNTNTIVNAMSGESSKIINTLTESADDTIDSTSISSGEIYNSLGFEVAQDPYSNFWLTLTNNLKSALIGSVRSIDISFQGRTWTISLDNYFVLPSWLSIILVPITTSLMSWVLVRQWKVIINKLSSGNVDSLLKENSQEGISNLF